MEAGGSTGPARGQREAAGAGQDATADPQQDAADRALRAGLRSIWASVAPGWEEHAAFIDEREAHVTERMLELAEPRAGDRVLELACGPGGLGLAAAPRVAPGGEVVLSDVAAEMTAIAARRAEALGLGHVATRVLDIEAIDEPDGSYDVVLCRAGLMFATDAARAAREIHRVLRQGGRAAIAVWGPRDRNPWLALVLDAVSEQTGAPVPPPGIPGPFSLDDAARLDAVLQGAGLSASIEEVEVPLRAGSFEEWWARTIALAGPLARILESMPEEATGAIRARLAEQTQAHRSAGGLELPGLSLLAGCRRA